MDPLTSLKSQGFTGHEHDIGPLVSPLHLVLSRPFTLLPAGPGGEVQRRRFIRRTADVPRADDAMAVGDGEVEQAPLVHRFIPQLRRRGVHEAVDALDGLQHRLPEHVVPESVDRVLVAVRVIARLFEAVEKEGKGPFAVRVALDADEPFPRDAQGEFAFDVPPAGDVAVVHEHETAVGEGMAVRVGKAALGGGAHVGEDQRRCCLGGEAGKVDAVPRGRYAGEDARFGPERWRCVVANAEAVAIVRAAVVLEHWTCHPFCLTPPRNDDCRGAHHAEA